MKIVDVSLSYDDKLETEEQLLRQHYSTVGWAESLHRKGIEVITLKRFSKEASLKLKGVHYYFIKDKFKGRLRFWQFPRRIIRKIVSLEPDIVHLHQFSLSIQTFLLRKQLKKNTGIVVQHHGGPTHQGIKKTVHDLFNSVADAFFFTTKEQGEQWFRNKVLHHKIFTVMEGSTFFNYETRDASMPLYYQDRNEARKLTGLDGDPVFLWVGRLDENKDPLTVLDGFEVLFIKYPAAKLYMIYTEDKLITEVKNKINRSDILNPRVHLFGNLPHPEIQNYYNSADYFVLGSHYEGSGYALSEALRCGCVPVITNIPSFKMMTDEGKLGALWEPGDKNSFIEAANRAMNKPLREEADACIDFFNKNLSFDAIAEQAIKHYRKITEIRNK